MKDRIKFNDAMLAAVMDGRKTQTRRPMKVQPVLNGNWWEVYGAGWGKDSKSMPAVPGHSLANNCPYGKVGEIISVADKDGNIKGKIEITDVWIQQVQEISQQDAMKEGAPPSHPSIDIVSREYGFPDFSRSWFAQVWMDIYGIDSWMNNEWVWVIEFKNVS
ncbi:ASCH domain-containing protein [Providencia sp. 2.29]|uniref:ASCH domain-containing protein n=1 Tax=Providencia sp. 2.29 TaxID=2791982 RepID=UPI0034D71FB5